MTTKILHIQHNYDGTIDEFYGTPEEAAERSAKKHSRYSAYDIGVQLNALHDDIKAGLFGEAAKTGEFMAYLTSVKEQFPKP